MVLFNNSVNNLFKNQPVTNITGAYTILATDTLISSDAVVGYVLTLPQGTSANKGKIYYIKDVSGTASVNNITVQPASGLIDNRASRVLAVDYGWLSVYSDGADWWSIDFSTPESAFVWEAKSASFTASSNTGYYSTGSAITATMPVFCSVGQIFAFARAPTSTGNLTIQMGASQFLYFGNTNSNLSGSGTCVSSAAGDTVFLLCTSANTDFMVTDAIGNWQLA